MDVNVIFLVLPTHLPSVLSTGPIQGQQLQGDGSSLKRQLVMLKRSLVINLFLCRIQTGVWVWVKSIFPRGREWPFFSEAKECQKQT